MSDHVNPTVRRSLAGALAQGRQRALSAGQPVLVSVASPLRDVPDIVSLWEAAAGSPYRALWGRPAQGFWMLGLGEALSLGAGGVQQFSHAQAQHRRWMESAVIAAPAVPGAGPTWFCAFRFDPQTPADEEWRSLCASALMLPRLTFVRSVQGSWLTLNATVQADSEVETLAAGLIEEADTYLRPSACPGAARPAPVELTDDDQARARWNSAVEKALGAIQRGRLEKVVLARRVRLRGAQPLASGAVVKKLASDYPQCLLFAFAAGGSCFLGASPELLARLGQGQLSSTCLAGSAPRGRGAGEDEAWGQRLLTSAKDLREHSLVVQALREGLTGLCSDLRWNESPALVKLPNVQHLQTSFTGVSSPGLHVLDVVKRLHPTPAVGGVPPVAALQAIRSLEGMDRGWYAGPIGWMDRRGEGEFGVALRCALLRGDSALLYAGAGIVAGSDRDREWAELELKLNAVRAALALEGTP